MIVYQILAYLYQRLKNGEPVDVKMLSADSAFFQVNGQKLKSRYGGSVSEMSNERLSDVVSAIVEAANEIKDKSTHDAQDYGQLLAYAECLSIIRDSYDGELDEIGLDFDIDKRYL